MANNKTNKKELKFANFEELNKNAKFDFKNINFNSTQVCNSLLKMYDRGNLLNSTGEDEDAYLLLMKFFEAYSNLRKSKLFKEDRQFVEKMITNDMLKKTIDKLESIKESLTLRYNLRAQIETDSIETQFETKPIINEPTQQQIIANKKFISPFDLTELICKTDLKYMLIDTRPKNEYDYSHVNLSILLNDPKTKSQCTFLNISSDLIETVSWRIEESLKRVDPELTYKLFASRHEYDYLILLDSDSTRTSLNKTDCKLGILKKALYEYEQERKLKNEPLVLEGGWSEWIHIYPAYSISSNLSSTNIFIKEPLVNNKINNENALTSLKKTLDFDYPELINFSKPTQPVAQIPLNINQPTLFATKVEQTEIDLKPLITSAESVNEKEVKKSPSTVQVSVQQPQKPIVNRTNKPVDLISSDTKSEKNQTDKKSLVFDSSSEDEEPITDTQDKKQPDVNSQPNITSVNIANNQNITHIKYTPPLPSMPPIPPQFADSQSDKKVITNSKIFDSVYRPSVYRPIAIRDGTSKILDPDTGVFKIYTTSTQPAPKPNIVPAVNKPDKEAVKKSILKRTVSIPNISSTVDENDSDNDDPKDELKENKENNENKEETKIDPPKNENLSSRTNNNTISNKLKETQSANDLETTEKISKNNPKKQAVEKPTINRDTKPMTDRTNLTRSRIQELQPIYAAVSPGLTGIKNLGNTCFMNSIIQCLNSTQPLVDYFQTGQYMKDLNRTNDLGFRGEIAEEFSLIVSASWSGHCKTIAPRKFKNTLGQFNQQFVSNEQQDAQELLLFLLDGLHEDLNRIRRRPKLCDKEDENENLNDEEAAVNAWKIHLSVNNSIIVDLFQGQFKSTVTCLSCQKKSVKFDAFMYLTLPILAYKCNLYQCLELFLKPEQMTGESKWKCPQCKQYRNAVKKIDIWKLPPILIVHLKRFRYHGLWRDKITTMVDYPIENLNLDKYIINNNENKRLGAQNYKLYAISNHSGTLDGGHYVAHCRHKELNKWFKYDDTDVKEVIDHANLKSSTSYILFYSRI